MSALAALLVYAALCALALAMTRHHRRVFGREISTALRRALRLAGWSLLALSFAATLRAHGAEVGLVAWFAAAAAAGFVLTLLLAFAPRLWPLPLAGLLWLTCT